MLQQHERPLPRPPELATVVRAAADGDSYALDQLVRRFERLLRGVLRFYRLSRWDEDDVIQSTWLQFLQHGRNLREPAAVSGWLATTARRQALRLLQRHVNECLMEDPARDESAAHAEPDRELLDAERRALVHGALAELPDRQGRLMQVLVARPDLSYEEVGRLLAMPVGSIGPTRARSLVRLREDERLQALQAAGA